MASSPLRSRQLGDLDDQTSNSRDVPQGDPGGYATSGINGFSVEPASVIFGGGIGPVAGAGFSPIGKADPTGSAGAGAASLITYSGALHNATPFSGIRDVDAALIGSKWNSLSLTFSFPTAANQYQAGYGSNPAGSGFDTNPGGFVAFNAAQQAAAIYALTLISAYTPLSFTSITETTTTHATFRFSQTTDASLGSAHAWFPANLNQAGDVWFGQTNQPFYLTPAVGNWGQATVMHELGHAMGLKHGHQDYTNQDLSFYLDPGGAARYGSTSLPPNHNGQSWSLMTYASDPGDPNGNVFQGEGFNQPQTYMQDDIAALQYLYGANTAYNSGATVYTFSTTTGQMFINGSGQPAPTSNIIYRTIWDGGGSDTYDLSNYVTNLTIDLRPGAFTNFGMQLANNRARSGGTAIAPGNIATALNCNIESATGGSANDLIICNPNLVGTLRGGGGSDTFQSTLFGLSVYTLPDLTIGDKINFTDGNLSTFVYRWNNTTLFYGNGTISRSLTLNGPAGRFLLSADAQYGGVDLTLSSYYSSTLPGTNWNAISAADFNLNGDADILLQDSNTGSISVWSMDGAVLVVGGGPPNVPGSNWHAVIARDFNGDGRADVVFQNADNGQITIWTMNGSTLTSAGGPPNVPGNRWRAFAAGDFNLDGKNDIALQDSLTGQISIWLMNGQNLISGGGPPNVAGSNWRAFGTGDFNGDGKADVVMQDSGTGAISIWLMNGQSLIAGGGPPNIPGNNWRAFGVGDFNGDGKPDIAFQDTTNGQISIWQMNGQALITGGAIPNIPGSSYQAISVADFNGDGKPDIFFRNSDSSLAVWQLNGTTLMEGGIVHSIGDDPLINGATDGLIAEDDGGFGNTKLAIDEKLLQLTKPPVADGPTATGGPAADGSGSAVNSLLAGPGALAGPAAGGDMSLLTNYMASTFADALSTRMADVRSASLETLTLTSPHLVSPVSARLSG